MFRQANAPQKFCSTFMSLFDSIHFGEEEQVFQRGQLVVEIGLVRKEAHKVTDLLGGTPNVQVSNANSS